MSLILASTHGISSTYAALPHTVIAVGEFETTDWREPSKKVTVDYEVFEIAPGCIVARWTNHNVRIMSDVWADTYHCVIALDDGTFLEVSYACSEGHYYLEKHTKCEVDAEHLLPAYNAWKAKREEERRIAEEARMAPILAAQKLEAEKKAARKAKADAKLAGARTLAEQALAAAPKKGSTVKVGTVVGKVFWAGVTQHRGKVSARLGVKDAKGQVTWCDASEATEVSAPARAA